VNAPTSGVPSCTPASTCRSASASCEDNATSRTPPANCLTLLHPTPPQLVHISNTRPAPRTSVCTHTSKSTHRHPSVNHSQKKAGVKRGPLARTDTYGSAPISTHLQVAKSSVALLMLPTVASESRRLQRRLKGTDRTASSDKRKTDQTLKATRPGPEDTWTAQHRILLRTQPRCASTTKTLSRWISTAQTRTRGPCCRCKWKAMRAQRTRMLMLRRRRRRTSIAMWRWKMMMMKTREKRRWAKKKKEKRTRKRATIMDFSLHSKTRTRTDSIA
ncbi:hypothetical protein BGZ74_002061, partial [Mortierella antarctica]